MCDIYAGTPSTLYEPVTRSIRLDGVVTSIRLERQFWDILDKLAAEEGLTTPRFVSALYAEVLERRGQVGNLASLLRVVCTVFLDRRGNDQAKEVAA